MKYQDRITKLLTAILVTSRILHSLRFRHLHNHSQYIFRMSHDPDPTLEARCLSSRAQSKCHLLRTGVGVTFARSDDDSVAGNDMPAGVMHRNVLPRPPAAKQ